jgi:hypothetical protein
VRGLLILQLERRAVDRDVPGRFVGVDEYAEGFTLYMPADEWDYLGRPEQVQFVCSGSPLGVRAQWIEPRERLQ